MNNIHYVYQHHFKLQVTKDSKSCDFVTDLLNWKLLCFWDEYGIAALLLHCKPPETRKYFSVKARVFMEVSLTESPHSTIAIMKKEVTFSDSYPAVNFPIPGDDLEKLQGESLKCSLKMSILDNTRIWPLVNTGINFMSDNHTSNAILQVGGKHFHVNLDLLSMYSTYFEDKESNRRNGSNLVIHIDGVKAEIMETILRFMYYGSLNIKMKTVSHLLSGAKALKIDAIIAIGEAFLLTTKIHSQRHLLTLLDIAYTYDMSLLQEKCLKKMGVQPFDEVTAKVTAEENVNGGGKFSWTLNLDSGDDKKFGSEPGVFGTLYRSKVLSKLLLTIEPSVPGFELKRATNWHISMDIQVVLPWETRVMKDVWFDRGNWSKTYEFNHPLGQQKPIPVKLEIGLTVYGLRNFLSPIDVTHMKGVKGDFEIIASGRILCSRIGVLAHFSHYFEAVRNRLDQLPLSAKGLPVLELNDVDSDDFEELLGWIWIPNSMNSKIQAHTEESLARLLTLAQRFLMTNVIIEIYQHLQESVRSTPTLRKLASDLNLEHLASLV